MSSQWILWSWVAGLGLIVASGCDSRKADVTTIKTERTVDRPADAEKKGKVEVHVNPSEGVKVDVEKRK